MQSATLTLTSLCTALILSQGAARAAGGQKAQWTPELARQAMKSDSSEDRVRAVKFLLQRHDPANPPLEEMVAAMGDASMDVRKAVYDGVGGAPWLSAPVAERLVELARDPDRIEEAQYGLQRYGDNRDKTGDGTWQPQPAAAPLLAAVETLTGDAQRAVAMAAVLCGAKFPDELALKLVASDPEAWDSWAGYWAEYCRSKNPKVIEFIRSELRAGDTGNGWHLAQLANGLGQIGPEAAAGVPELIAAMDDERGHVRRYAARALAMIGKAAEPALARIKDLAANDPDKRVKSWCADAATALETRLAQP